MTTAHYGEGVAEALAHPQSLSPVWLLMVSGELWMRQYSH